jgi:hypothetical protein|tara:strand:- start:1649 stop:2026 length:378 start_codon:yes stop_codon:yes gene_type:complete
MIPLVLTFNNPINVSVQVGDYIYYTPTQTVGTVTPFDTADIPNVVRLGPIESIAPNPTAGIDITVTWDDANIAQPNSGDFIMFEKDKRLNTPSLLGYFASVRLVNNSRTKAEIFSLGSETFESSK